MNFKKEIEKLLKSLKSKGLGRRAIEEKLKYSPKYIDQALARGGNEDLLHSIKMLHDTIPDPAVINEGKKFYAPIPKGSDTINRGPKHPADSYNDKALFNLTESNRMQSEASLMRAENEGIVARAHDRLVKILENKLTESDLKDTVAILHANLLALREFATGRFSEVQKQTPQQVAAALGKMEAEYLKKAGKDGIPTG